ncbi:uncharacterized protein MYCFIDRAFT_87637 [Pseudocercospora fijiensis CIRAD86]|uniref:NAD-dependent epimerase/dehydratase domain-containing protein n=1 Tax=Pseudocercospora fijiensis (strain CIRAD86) TaxID=383855 RepID=M2ZUM5_PSEFD|nr:uncharacterized protein MYCFIDRAFT_87637 [Pseudocercospora fijiensis CIRAD86]EME82709.1 hypothetical protein MYCFIDRAFT_87637 [Pseudocercospora fijiensis CIRAD86]
MHIFVTGASGFVGQATLAELTAHGHEVSGLARNDASADKLAQQGAKVVRGGLEDLEVIKKAAQASDAVVHLAFIHDFSSPEAIAKSNKADRELIAAVGEALAGSNKPFVIVTGILGLPRDQLATEDSEPVRTGPMAERQQASDLLFASSKDNSFKGMVVRFPPTVHGKGDQAFITMLGNIAKQNGFVTYINDGAARWPATHRNDVASMLRLAVEKGTAGAIYHAIAEEGVAMKDIMTAVGSKLQLPVQSKTPEEAQALLGFFGPIVGADNPTSSEISKKALGWQPTQPGLVEDIAQNYF